jgi:hypothetical protein
MIKRSHTYVTGITPWRFKRLEVVSINDSIDGIDETDALYTAYKIIVPFDIRI